ncbi:MAG: ATP-dependent RNA helicase HrpA [Gammaproteobacteria bacterium]|nr:ATP-dependent RNA helicase HrpA [Gammaproteobacteria bacterium]
MYFEAAKIHQQIDLCMRAEQHRLRKRLRQISNQQKSRTLKPDVLEKLLADIATSVGIRQQRQANRPQPSYPQDLPVVQKRETILRAIEQHQVTIICGETGSGKTTQIPKICLELGRGVAGIIGHTQPRRLAARSVTSRIAEELNSETGQLVGFKIRFNDRVSAETRVKLMTDGILLAEIQSDPYLDQYDTLIIDEAHERSLNIDFLLGYLKQLLPRRPDLKLIVTSATIDPQRFSRHFDNAPIIMVEGRTWPVELRYRPLEEFSADDEDSVEETAALLQACEELAAEGGGDILVFLPGEREIREHAAYLGKKITHSKRLRGSEVLPLFARLSTAEQNRIFAAHGQRRIVLATNVAETSLTVPGIRYVVDFGLARVSRYSVRSKVQRLPIEPVSQASANQRKGRCGREAPGICLRLYSEEDFASRPEFTEPEILRTNLASVILQMEVMHLGHVENFPFVEAPEMKYINDGYVLLHEIGAVEGKRKLTRLGRSLARLPIDPRLARMLFGGRDEGCVEEMLTIVSALSVQDPRERPLDKQQAADEMHAEFNDGQSDFLAWLNLWEFLEVQGKRLSNNQFRKMCRQRFLSWPRIREWREVRRQLQSMLRQEGFSGNNRSAAYDNIHRALLSGLLANVAVKDDKSAYLGTRNRKITIFPGSGLFKSGPKWLMAAEISETTKLYARGVAMIKPEWIESLSGHLLKYSYFGARWQQKRGQVGAYQKSTLYGLEINPKKRVNYGPINPQEAREIFIREALVEGHFNSSAAFFLHNRQLLDEVQTLEDKSRRRDIVVDSQTLYYFYDGIVPEGIYSTPQFESWRKDYEREFPKGLFYTRELLLQSDDAGGLSPVDFPDHMEFSGVVLPLSYHFDPDADDDGVTLTVPVTIINRVSSKQCEWLVPGMLEEKLIELLRRLPKSLRRNFVPVPDVARDCHARMEVGDKSLLGEFSLQLKRMSGVEVPMDTWSLSALPKHLRMNFRLIDSKGQVLEQGRNLVKLQERYADRVEESLAQTTGNSFEREDVSDWNFGDLPLTVELENAGVVMQGYPALKDEGDKIALRLFATEVVARHEMRLGLRALYKKVLTEEVKYMRRKLPGIQQLCLRFAPFGSCEELTTDIIDAVIDQTCVDDAPFVRSREQFLQILADQRGELLLTANTICNKLAQIFERYRAVSKRLDGAIPLSWIEPAADIQDQLSALLYKGFVSATPPRWLNRLPAYLEAIDKRLDAIDQAPDKDRKRRAEFLPLWERYKQMPKHLEHVEDYEEQRLEIRWLIEELRVSIFAQTVGTSEKVSIKRLETRMQGLLAG